jgi:RNA polymerase sigma factor (sigma-70 family)
MESRLMGIDEGRASDNGWDSELTDLLRRIWPRQQKILAAYHIPPEDAEDLVQDTLIQFVRKRKHIHSPEQWFAGALRNQCRMYWRTRSRKLTVAVDDAILDVMAGGAESGAERAVLRYGVARYIAKLSPNCQRLLRLRYRLDLDDDEVAEETGYRPGSVDKVTRRCVQTLSKKIAAADIGRRSPRP